MTIRIFPSRLPGEPLERHEHGPLTLHEWMSKNVPSYSLEKVHPITVELSGQILPPNEWPLCYLQPDSDVRIYPVPYGTGLEIEHGKAWRPNQRGVRSQQDLRGLSGTTHDPL